MPATDYTRTNNPRSIHLAEMARPFPEWVKGSPIPAAAELEKLASVAFADRAHRLLPIHDKAAAFYSAVDYFANVDKYPADTFDTIKEACHHFHIGQDVAPYAEIFAEGFEKRAAADAPAEQAAGRFAVETHLDGREFRILPLNDAYEINKSASDLRTMVAERRIHYLMFVEAAREIVKAAAETEGVDELPAVIEAAGVARFPDFAKAASLIESRRSVVKDHEGAYAAYTGAVAEGAAGTISPDECMQKLAAIDDALGVKYRHDAHTRVPLPHVIIFGGPRVDAVEKLAAARVLVRSVPIPLEAVRKIPTIDIHFHLEKAAAQQLLTLRDNGNAAPLSLAAAEWSEDDQKTLLRLAVTHG